MSWCWCIFNSSALFKATFVWNRDKLWWPSIFQKWKIIIKSGFLSSATEKLWQRKTEPPFLFLFWFLWPHTARWYQLCSVWQVDPFHIGPDTAITCFHHNKWGLRGAAHFFVCSVLTSDSSAVNPTTTLDSCRVCSPSAPAAHSHSPPASLCLLLNSYSPFLCKCSMPRGTAVSALCKWHRDD